MAKTRTSHIRNMRSGAADNTRIPLRIASDEEVLAAVDAWDAYFAEYTAWEADNVGQPISAFEDPWREAHDHSSGNRPPEFAAVADRENITDAESWFAEVRFFTIHDNGDADSKAKAPWCQLNDTLVPNIPPAFFGGLRKIFNARRKKLNLEPAA